MNATRVEIEEIASTKSEKLLAFVLAAFLLIGGMWTYVKVDDYVREAVGAGAPATARERALFDRQERAQVAVSEAETAHRRARDELELQREAYRTALDEGRRDPALAAQYRAAQARLERAQRTAAAATDAAARAAAAAEPARRAVEARDQRLEDRRELLVFGFRFAFVVLVLAGALLALARLRRRGSRALPLAVAGVAFATVLAFVMAADYITDYVDPLDLGPLVLSLFGIGVTLLAFVALQRYLAQRLPQRRVRKLECPFCGYPVRENRRCEGCGREAVAPCSTCAQPRRVGARFCGACGAA